MAYNAPPAVTTGQLATASDHNTYTKDNIIALRAGEIALTSQADDDFIKASSATQFTRQGSADVKLWMEVFLG